MRHRYILVGILQVARLQVGARRARLGAERRVTGQPRRRRRANVRIFLIDIVPCLNRYLLPWKPLIVTHTKYTRTLNKTEQHI